jgi:hypothetical protein
MYERKVVEGSVQGLEKTISDLQLLMDEAQHMLTDCKQRIKRIYELLESKDGN